MKFINSYVKASSGLDGYMEVVGWVRKSPLVTNSFKSALNKLHTNALRDNPEAGCGADAVLSSQDPPDRYEVAATRPRGTRRSPRWQDQAGPKTNPQKLSVRHAAEIMPGLNTAT